jgi:hypothetical protein
VQHPTEYSSGHNDEKNGESSEERKKKKTHTSKKKEKKEKSSHQRCAFWQKEDVCETKRRHTVMSSRCLSTVLYCAIYEEKKEKIERHLQDLNLRG